MDLFRLRRATLGTLLTAPFALAATPVRYPEQDLSAAYKRYPVRLLELALAHAGNAYTVAPTSKMLQSRALAQIQEGQGVDVIWTATSNEREANLLPIRIPLYKGLFGWRLLLIRKDDAARFSAIRELKQLKAMRCVQGHDWPDTDILRAAGFNVRTVANTDAMFKLLESGAVDYFPRSAAEIWDEAAAHPELMVETNFALHYPNPVYFFVHPKATALARDLRAGLEKLIADGSYERLFHQYYDALLRRARLKQRRLFELPNALLPAATPLARKILWLND